MASISAGRLAMWTGMMALVRALSRSGTGLLSIRGESAGDFTEDMTPGVRTPSRGGEKSPALARTTLNSTLMPSPPRPPNAGGRRKDGASSVSPRIGGWGPMVLSAGAVQGTDYVDDAGEVVGGEVGAGG
jgi:hypothetical protein